MLFGKKFWTPLLGWLAEEVLADGYLGPADLDRVRITDDPMEAVKLVTNSRTGQVPATRTELS